MRSDDAAADKDKIDVLILCGGSATDLPVADTGVCEDISTLSTALIPTQESRSILPMWTQACKESGTRGASFPWAGIRVLFSLNRMYAECHSAGGQGPIPSGARASARAIPMRSAGSAGVKDAASSTPIPVPEAAGSGSCRQESGADHQTETHQRVLCCG